MVPDSTEASAAQQQRSLAEATLEKVRNGLAGGQLPVVGQIVRIIREISEKAESMSAQDLAEVISQDPSTMNRILAIAGTLGFNPAGVEITSMQQAVMVVGFERIRNLAVSVLLLENVEQQRSMETNREMAGLALASGLIASGLGARSGLVNPDLAFLCGSLRSYGRMLMSSFLSEEFEEAMANAVDSRQTDQSLKRKFGLTPLELGHELLKGMQLPPMILKALQELPPTPPEEIARSSADALQLAAELSIKLADALAHKALGPGDFALQLSSLFKDAPKEFVLKPHDIRSLLTDAVSHINTFSQAGNYTKGHVTLFKRMECLSEGRKPPPPFIPKRKDKSDTETRLASKSTTPATSHPATPHSHLQNATATPATATEAPDPKAVLDRTSAKLKELRAAPHTAESIQGCFQLILHSLRIGLDLQSGLIFVRDPSGTCLKLEQGFGPLLQTIGAQGTILPGQRDIFGVPLSRGEDVLIQKPDELRLQAFIPEWLRKPGQCLPFVLLPVADKQGAFALICGVSRNQQAFSLIGKMAEELRALRTELAHYGPLVRARTQQPATLRLP